jgi:hypothetical protein
MITRSGEQECDCVRPCSDAFPDTYSDGTQYTMPWAVGADLDLEIVFILIMR